LNLFGYSLVSLSIERFSMGLTGRSCETIDYNFEVQLRGELA